jgi:hypothetical protein
VHTTFSALGVTIRVITPLLFLNPFYLPSFYRHHHRPLLIELMIPLSLLLPLLDLLGAQLLYPLTLHPGQARWALPWHWHSPGKSGFSPSPSFYHHLSVFTSGRVHRLRCHQPGAATNCFCVATSDMTTSYFTCARSCNRHHGFGSIPQANDLPPARRHNPWVLSPSRISSIYLV